jgi:hypothetical protein
MTQLGGRDGGVPEELTAGVVQLKKTTEVSRSRVDRKRQRPRRVSNYLM